MMCLKKGVGEIKGIANVNEIYMKELCHCTAFMD